MPCNTVLNFGNKFHQLFKFFKFQHYTILTRFLFSFLIHIKLSNVYFQFSHEGCYGNHTITLSAKKETFFFKLTSHPKSIKVQTELTLHRSEHKCFIAQITLYLYTTKHLLVSFLKLMDFMDLIHQTHNAMVVCTFLVFMDRKKIHIMPVFLTFHAFVDWSKFIIYWFSKLSTALLKEDR